MGGVEWGVWVGKSREWEFEVGWGVEVRASRAEGEGTGAPADPKR
jgi:hypothetical protein